MTWVGSNSMSALRAQGLFWLVAEDEVGDSKVWGPCVNQVLATMLWVGLGARTGPGPSWPGNLSSAPTVSWTANNLKRPPNAYPAPWLLGSALWVFPCPRHYFEDVLCVCQWLISSWIIFVSKVSVKFLSFCFFFSAVPLHMDIPRLGIESELQLPPYASTTATPDPCYICNLHHSAQQCQILNPLSRARVWIHILMHTSRVHDHWATRELQGSFLFTNGYPEFVGKTILSSSNYIVTFIYENISCLCHMYYMLNVWVTFHLSVCLALWRSHRVLFPAKYS